MGKTEKKIFSDFDFRRLNSSDFKEDSVREELVLPILKALGYSGQQIVRSKSLSHPFVKIGSKKRQINIVPDYLLKIEDTYAWVLDAKAPTENILHGENVDQVFSYSMHPEIRTKFFALCNGKEFVLFRQDTEKPILYFQLRDIDRYWERLETLLSPDSFQIGKSIVYPLPSAEKRTVQEFDYLNRPLLEEIKEIRRQSAKRHKGVHGYFTRQVWNVVQEYIQNFTQAGDLILDPFGGTGVTAIETLMLDRRSIHMDINPLSPFIVDCLVAPIKIAELVNSFNRVKEAFIEKRPDTKKEIKATLKKYPYPKGFILPKSSDVSKIEDLFSEKKLAQLALLKHLIVKEKNENNRKSLLLAFSSSIYKLNLTYQAPTNVSDGGGNSGVFAYYRYRIAPKAADIDVLDCFSNRFLKIVDAKREIENKINAETIHNIKIVKGSATNLGFIKSKSVDYIYTDPPYGKKIPYLDLSIMWNAWLDLEVTEKDYQEEAIEGGEHNKSKEEYSDLISKSIEEMYRVLKFDRWMSFVFAHKDPEFWHLIVDTAERAGFEYAGAVKQANGQTSFKKRQNPFTVLSGQLIINFKKVRKPKAILKANLGMKIGDIIFQTIEGIIAKHNGATLEQINDEIIIKGLELGFLDLLKKEYSDLTPLLLSDFDFDEETHLFSIKKDGKFKTHIDLNLRIRYYLISFLRRQMLEKKQPTFDEICTSYYAAS